MAAYLCTMICELDFLDVGVWGDYRFCDCLSTSVILSIFQLWLS